MNELKFTIIIPTKNRADTLYWALKTCVEQQYQNLNIIVSDNFSDDNTKEVALSFNDRRIQYINTGKSLSMSGNWEFALSHVKEGFVSFLGDDDAFLPGAISMVNKMANETGCKAINAAAIEYTWPNHIRPLYRNKMFFRKNAMHNFPNVDEILVNVLHGKHPYSVLPWIYKGFVSMELIQKIKKISDHFFLSVTPDIYSAIAISAIINPGKYYYSEIPFAINGASSHSNGISQGAKIKNAGAMEFLSDLNLPFHKDLVVCNSFPIYVYECYLQARDAGLFNNNPDLISIKEIFELAIQKAQSSNKTEYLKIKNALFEIGAKNRIDKLWTNKLLRRYPYKNILYRSFSQAWNFYYSSIKPINMELFQVKNVYDAAFIANKIITKQITVPSSKVIQEIAGDFKSVLKNR